MDVGDANHALVQFRCVPGLDFVANEGFALTGYLGQKSRSNLLGTPDQRLLKRSDQISLEPRIDVDAKADEHHSQNRNVKRDELGANGAVGFHAHSSLML